MVRCAPPTCALPSATITATLPTQHSLYHPFSPPPVSIASIPTPPSPLAPSHHYYSTPPSPLPPPSPSPRDSSPPTPPHHSSRVPITIPLPSTMVNQFSSSPSVSADHSQDSSRLSGVGGKPMSFHHALGLDQLGAAIFEQE